MINNSNRNQEIYEHKEQIRSPLTNSLNVVLEEAINSEIIINLYQDEYNIDVRKYFEGINTVQIYKCLDTNYRFYYPLYLTGDSKLYEELQKQSWYYGDWKWEHQIASNFMKTNDSILELGCARGAFIDKLQQKGLRCTGLEFNEDAVRVGQEKGLNILKQSIEEHAQLNPEIYDVVCSFQVLEHISLVKDFVSACLKALKPGGKFIVGVPNNNPFLFKYDKYHTLNLPPHHLGLWNKSSLENLQKVFPIRVEKLFVEPLQEYEYYFKLQVQHFKSKSKLLGEISDMLLFSRIPLRVRQKLQRTISYFVQGRNIVAVYTKL